MNTLERAVGQVTRVLDEQRVPYMIIGGIANLVWGEPRTTLDVDAAVLVDEAEWPDLIQALRHAFHVLPKAPMAFLRDTHVLPVETQHGVRIDLVWARLPYEHKAIARATTEVFAGHRIRVCRPEDLVIHKIISERPKDREDVRAIIRQQRSRLDRRYLRRAVRELARALEQPDLVTFLETCLSRSS